MLESLDGQPAKTAKTVQNRTGSQVLIKEEIPKGTHAGRENCLAGTGTPGSYMHGVLSEISGFSCALLLRLLTIRMHLRLDDASLKLQVFPVSPFALKATMLAEDTC